MHLVAIHTVQYNDTKGVQHVAEPGSMFEFFGDTDRLITLGAARAASVDELVLAGFQDERPSLDLHPLVIQSPVVPLALDPAMQTPAVNLVAEDTVAEPVNVNVVNTIDPSEPVAEVVPARRRRRAVAETAVAETAVETVEVPAESEPAGDVAAESTETSEPTDDASEGEDDLL